MDTPTPHRAAQFLQQNGFVVIVDPYLSENVATLREHFLNAVRSFPEYARSPGNPDRDTSGKPLRYVGGGFGALGNPASFHNEFVRLLRQWCMAVVIPMFTYMLPTPMHQLEQIVDRMMFRLAKVQKPTPETWHRDIAPGAAPGDDVFGGWINLDLENQYFSGIVGSHTEDFLHRNAGGSAGAGAGAGFATIPKDQHKAMKNHPNKYKVTIPPGAIFIFYENMIHEVMGTKPLKYDSYRLFLGWRITLETSPLMGSEEELAAQFRDQAVMPIKSGQIPPMYPKLWWTNWFDKLLMPWSDASFVQRAKGVRVRKTTGVSHMVVHQEMPSLRAMGLPMYSPYSTEELQMYKPSNWWNLAPPGHTAAQPFSIVEEDADTVVDSDSEQDVIEVDSDGEQDVIEVDSDGEQDVIEVDSDSEQDVI